MKIEKIAEKVLEVYSLTITKTFPISATNCETAKLVFNGNITSIENYNAIIDICAHSVKLQSLSYSVLDEMRRCGFNISINAKVLLEDGSIEIIDVVL